jgi:hypothetical protein
VADLQHAPGAFRRLDHPQAIHRIRGDGLLQQHVIAPVDRSEGGLDVERVAGGDDRRLREAGPIQRLLPVRQHRGGGQTVLGRDGVASRRVGLGDRDDAQPVGMLPGVGPVHGSAPEAGSDEHGRHGRSSHHDLLLDTAGERSRAYTTLPPRVSTPTRRDSR